MEDKKDKKIVTADFVACGVVEAGFSTFVAFLETLVSFPLILLNALQSIITTMESLVLNNIDLLFEEFQKMLNNFRLARNSDVSFCDVWKNCNFLVGTILPSPDDNGFYKFGNKTYNRFELFEILACGAGAGDMFGSLLGDLKQKLFDKIDVFNEKFDYIDEQINKAKSKYTNFIKSPITSYWSSFPTVWQTLFIFNWVKKEDFDPETANILDVINLLEEFSECIFSVCALRESVENKLDDLRSKLSIDKRTGRYVPNKKEIKIKARRKEIDAAVAESGL